MQINGCSLETISEHTAILREADSAVGWRSTPREWRCYFPTGDEDWGGTFWDSSDLWIRHADDGGTTHQGPMEGIDNWFYARVRNRNSSTAQHFMVTFTVKPWAGTEFVYPADFIPCTAATGGFELAPDEEKIVSVKWPAASVPPAEQVPMPTCWLDNMIFIWYSNLDCPKPIGTCSRISRSKIRCHSSLTIS